MQDHTIMFDLFTYHKNGNRFISYYFIDIKIIFVQKKSLTGMNQWFEESNTEVLYKNMPKIGKTKFITISNNLSA